jgi:undecaprenyl-phosphate galactose phosphotransferase
MVNESYKNQNDARLWDYLKKNPELKQEWDKYQKLDNDPRILPGMNFMRKASLDELAQLFNVLTGDMSIVGPRPFMIRERELIGTYFERVLAAKPGITDLWTVSGRDALSFEQRLKMSTWYIQNWSIWLDFVIIAKTIQQVILYFLKWFKPSKKQ